MRDGEPDSPSHGSVLGTGVLLFALCVIAILAVCFNMSGQSSSSHPSSASGVIRSIDEASSIVSIELSDHDPSQFPFHEGPVSFELHDGLLHQDEFEVGSVVEVTYFYTLPFEEPLECCAMKIKPA